MLLSQPGPFPPGNLQRLLAIDQHAPTFPMTAIPAPLIARNHGAGPRLFCKLQHLVVERARLQPDGPDADLFRLAQELQRHRRRGYHGKRRLGWRRERFGRGCGGVGLAEGGDAGRARVDRGDGEGVLEVPYEYCCSHV